MRWRVAACAALLACASLSAQATRAVTFAWEMPEDDPGAQAEIERDGVAQWCQVQFSGQTRSCTLTVPVGAGVYRARMATIEGAWGPWLDAVTLTVPPVTPGSPPGPFVLLWHSPLVPPSRESTMASHAASASGGTSSGSTIATSSLGTAAAGDLVVVTANWYYGSFTSITDSAGGNTWTQIGSELPLAAGSLQYMRMYYSVLAVGGAGFTVTLTTSGDTFPSISADRFNGASGWTLDQGASAAPGSADTFGSTGATGTRSTANQVMVAGFATTHTIDTVWTAGSNVAWVLGGQWPTGSLACPTAQEYFLPSSAGTEAGEASWTTSAVWAARVATFSYTDGGGNAARAMHHYRMRRQ